MADLLKSSVEDMSLDEEFEQYEYETLLVHGDRAFQPSGVYDVAPAMHVTTTYTTPNPSHLVYSRAHHPTRVRLEKLLGFMEGGHAITYSSGLACVSALMQHIKPRKVFIAAKEGYFGCQDVMNFFKHIVETYADSKDSEPLFQVVDLETLDDFIEEHAGELSENQTPSATSDAPVSFKNGRQSPYVIWLETPKNPSCSLEDIQMYSQKAKKIGALVVVDSTFATPILQKPLELGADFVVHSATKYLSGHSDVLAGVVVTKSAESSKKLHKEQSVMGNVLGNMETWLLLRSVRTLQVRVNQQCQSALMVAEWLESQINNPETNCRVTKVWYPALKSSTYYELCQTQMGGKGSGMLSVELDTPENAEKFPALLKLITVAVSLGGYESLIDYRYIWDHTVSPLLLRISIGLENPQDIIKDIKQALKEL